MLPSSVALKMKERSLIKKKLPPLRRTPPGRALKPKLSVPRVGGKVFHRVDDFIKVPEVVL